MKIGNDAYLRQLVKFVPSETPGMSHQATHWKVLVSRIKRRNAPFVQDGPFQGERPPGRQSALLLVDLFFPAPAGIRHIGFEDMMSGVPAELQAVAAERFITEPSRQAAFRHGIDLFNHGRFFECHEVLEEIWTPCRGPERLFLQALIHFAVGFYHHQRKNDEGAARQLRKGLKKLEAYLPQFEKIDTARLSAQIRRRLRALETGGRIQKFPKIQRLQARRR
ncbi:MAG TPA: DUF309 domain-containing protein [Bryobacterales bacterium]|nr:DUF309 domain-containing protein [Bryobacterales bacterium]